MTEKMQNKYYEIMQKMETEQLPIAVACGDLTFKEVESLRYELENPNLRITIYEEFKVVYLGIYLKD